MYKFKVCFESCLIVYYMFGRFSRMPCAIAHDTATPVRQAQKNGTRYTADTGPKNKHLPQCDFTPFLKSSNFGKFTKIYKKRNN